MSKLCLQYVSKYECNDTSYIGILLKLPIQLAQVNMPSFFTAYIVNFVIFSFSKTFQNGGTVVLFITPKQTYARSKCLYLALSFCIFLNISNCFTKNVLGPNIVRFKNQPSIYHPGLNIIRNDIPPVSPIPLVFQRKPRLPLSLSCDHHPQSHSRRRVYADARDADYLIYDCRP